MENELSFGTQISVIWIAGCFWLFSSTSEFCPCFQKKACQTESQIWNKTQISFIHWNMGPGVYHITRSRKDHHIFGCAGGLMEWQIYRRFECPLTPLLKMFWKLTFSELFVDSDSNFGTRIWPLLLSPNTHFWMWRQLYQIWKISCVT